MNLTYTFTVSVTMEFTERPCGGKPPGSPGLLAPTGLYDHELDEMAKEIRDHLENCWPCEAEVEQVGRPWPHSKASK